MEVLLKVASPLFPPKVLVDVADGDLPEVGRAAARLASHLYASCQLVRPLPHRIRNIEIRNETLSQMGGVGWVGGWLAGWVGG